MTTAWERGTRELRDSDAGALQAAMVSTWRPENPQDLIDMLCILKSVIARSGVTGFPSHEADCFCRYRGRAGEYYQDSGDIFRFIAEAVRTALQVPASRRCHPTEARGKVLVRPGALARTAGPITRVMLGDGGWRVFTAAGSWWDAEGDADDPESQWVNVVDD